MDFLKLLKTLLAKGFATKEEKADVDAKFEKLDKEEKEIAKEEVEKIKNLPEKKKEEMSAEEKEIEKALGSILDKKVGNMEQKIKDAVIAYIKEQKVLIAKQVGNYAPDAKEKRAKLNKWFREMCREVIAGNVTKIEEMQKSAPYGIKKKEMSTDSGSSPFAGYVVDSELSAEIRHIMTEFGVARREGMVLQLSKNTYKANELTTDAVVYWVDEAGSIKSSQVVLGQETLELKKLATIIAFTNELLEDSEIDFIGFVGSRVAELLAEQEDEAVFNGDGTATYGGFTGLLESASVNTVTMTGTTFASIDADDLIDMVDATPSGALKNSKYYMHRTIMSYIRKLKDSDNQYIYQAPSQKGPDTAWGYPITHVEVMPTSGDTSADTAFVIFGDLKKGLLVGFKGGIKMLKADQATIRNVADSADINLFTSDRVGIRFTERFGFTQIITNLKKPITVLKTASASA